MWTLILCVLLLLLLLLLSLFEDDLQLRTADVKQFNRLCVRLSLVPGAASACSKIKEI